MKLKAVDTILAINHFHLFTGCPWDDAAKIKDKGIKKTCEQLHKELNDCQSGPMNGACCKFCSKLATGDPGELAHN